MFGICSYTSGILRNCADLHLAFCATAPTANGLPPALKHTLSLSRALVAFYKLQQYPISSIFLPSFFNYFPHKCSLILSQLAPAWNISIYRASSLYSLPNINFYFTICKLCVILQSLCITKNAKTPPKATCFLAFA
jgi:hypothetical protein